MNERRRQTAMVGSVAVVTLLVLLVAQRLDAGHRFMSDYESGSRGGLLPVAIGLVVAGILGIARRTPLAAERRDDAPRSSLPGTALPTARRAAVTAVRAVGWTLAAYSTSLVVAPMAVTGAGWIPIALATLLVGAAWFFRIRVLLLTTTAAVIALSAVWGAGLHDSLLGYGVVSVRPAYPTGLFDSAHAGATPSRTPPRGVTPEIRSGRGPTVVDLRAMHIDPATTLRIRARSDLGRVIVALPQHQCYALVVHYRTLSHPLPAPYVATGEALGYAMQSYDTPISSVELGPQPYPTDAGDTLLAFGEYQRGDSGTWRRAASDPKAPTLRLDLTTGSQIVIRDFPDVGRFSLGVPTAQSTDDTDDDSQLIYPASKNFDRSPLVGEAAGRMFDGTVDHAADLKLRAADVAWAARQARRLAGPCATRAALAARWVDATYYDGMSDDASAGGPVTVNGLGQVRRTKVTTR